MPFILINIAVKPTSVNVQLYVANTAPRFEANSIRILQATFVPSNSNPPMSGILKQCPFRNRMVAWNEVNMTCKFNNAKNVLQIYNFFYNSRHCYIFMEEAMCDLFEFIEKGRITMDIFIDFSNQLLNGLQLIHSSGVIHRDIKPENIFVFPDPVFNGKYILKYADFGFATTQMIVFGIDKVQGTHGYLAPETLIGTPEQCEASDVWALGCVMYAMLTGTFAYDAGHPQYIFNVTTGHYYKPYLPKDNDVIKLFDAIFEPDIHMRATISELREMLKKIEIVREPKAVKCDYNQIFNSAEYAFKSVYSAIMNE